MSVILSLQQIEKKNFISENKVFGLYEIVYKDIEWVQNGSDFLDLGYFPDIAETEKRKGVYYTSNINECLFYMLAWDTEWGIGYRKNDENEEDFENYIITAFDPKFIYKYLKKAKADTEVNSKSPYDDLLKIAKEAVEKGRLIVSQIG